MWEQRYGFPVPERTASGYRRYTRATTSTRCGASLALRQRGLSMPAAIERAQETRRRRPTARRSTPRSPRARPRRAAAACCASRRSSRCQPGDRARGARAAPRRPVVFGAFQQRALLPARSSAATGELARHADAVGVFADFPGGVRRAARRAGRDPDRRRRRAGQRVGGRSSTRPGYAACLLAWEQPGVAEPGGPDDATAASRRCGRSTRGDARARRRSRRGSSGAPTRRYGERLEELLDDRPLALRGAGAGAHRADQPDDRLHGGRRARLRPARA